MSVSFLCRFLCAGLAVAASVFAYPALTYSTYLRDHFTPKAIATDAQGNLYLAGNAVVDSVIPQTMVLVMKLNPQASRYVYVRYFGGSIGDFANALAVDSAGNAYVAGYTISPDFPVTAGGGLATPSVGGSQRSFVTKLDVNGGVVFSALLGGATASMAQAVTVTPAVQVLVSGTSLTSGFPSTSGAYSIGDTANHPYLLELDATGTKTIFSATGIGGSALAADSSGIYVAGTTTLLDYPTTTGAYQTSFPKVMNCASPDCAFPFPGTNQYVTKVDVTGSRLIYSTAVTGTRNTVNGGVAVDRAGNVYLTGFAGATYPYTVAVPTLPVEQSPYYNTLPFLTKLDAAGQSLVFSVPVGGAGVQIDAGGAVDAGGFVGSLPSSTGVLSAIPALAGVHTACLPDVGPGVHQVSAYVAQVDGSSGNLLGSQFLGGGSLTLAGVALSGSTVWAAGATNFADLPITPEALTIASAGANPLPGAYLGAVDFARAQPAAGTPQIGCITDSASDAQAGPAARYELLTIFGSGLGPPMGVAAADDSTTSLAGVRVTFGSTPAPLLYVSATQINVAVPLVGFDQSWAAMQVSVNGASAAPVAIQLTPAYPNLFPLALNADGAANSATHPAALGETVSVFLNGLSGLPRETPRTSANPASIQLATDDGWSIANVAAANRFVERVDLRVPAATSFPSYCTPPQASCTTSIGFSLYYFDPYSSYPDFSGRAMEGSVYVTAPSAR